MAKSLWRWRQDDLDTIFNVTNQGLMKKPYWVEYHDTYEDGTPMWNGEKSVFWNLIEQAFPEEKKQMAHRMMNKMEELGGLQKGTHQEKLFAYFQRYYFSAIDDFSAMLYNEDGKIYEQMKLAMLQGKYSNDTDPLEQSLGNGLSAEVAWVKKRIQYLMSKYSFGDYDAKTAEGAITVRTSAQADGSTNSIVLRLTPALKLYPTIGYGTTVIRGNRTDVGKVCEITVDINGTSDQQLSIKSADYLLDIGDWSSYVINGSLSIIGKRLKRLKLGDKEADKVKLLISSLTLGNTMSLEEIDVQNISTLAGQIDMRSNYRLSSFLAKGTKITEAHFAEGGALEKVEYPKAASYIELKNLDRLHYGACDTSLCNTNVMSYFVSGCDNLQPIKKLTEIMDAQSSQAHHALRYVRCVGFNETFSDGQTFEKLSRLVDGTYQGIDAEGQYGNDQYPVLDGTINLTTGAYRDSYDTLMTHYPKLKLNIAKWWIRFEDPEVKRICLENWDKDGDGEISMEEAAQVSSIGTMFRGRDFISLGELQYFGFRTMEWDAFRESHFKYIKLPETCQIIARGCFRDVKADTIDIPASVTLIDECSFMQAKVKNLIFRSVVPPDYNHYWEFMYHEIEKIFVPDVSVEKYKQSELWLKYELSNKTFPLSDYPKDTFASVYLGID